MADGPGLLSLDSVTNYEKLHRIGEGTYGVVYKARERSTGKIVALKKVRFEKTRDGVPVTSIREMRVLQQCMHPNVVRLIKVVTGSKADSVFLVFEYCEYDLGRVLDTKATPFTLPQIKQLMLQLLAAVAYLHHNWVLHRDIKMSNLLYCKTGQLKLCDLGLARYFHPEAVPMTPQTVTLWYRAPELLLGTEVYGEGVDMWAVGCVLGELLAHRALFPASSELEALRMQMDLLGSPTPASWPGMSSLPGVGMLKLPHQPHCRLHTLADPHTRHLHPHDQRHRLELGARRRYSLSPSRQHEEARRRQGEEWQGRQGNLPDTRHRRDRHRSTSPRPRDRHGRSISPYRSRSRSRSPHGRHSRYAGWGRRAGSPYSDDSRGGRHDRRSHADDRGRWHHHSHSPPPQQHHHTDHHHPHHHHHDTGRDNEFHIRRGTGRGSSPGRWKQENGHGGGGSDGSGSRDEPLLLHLLRHLLAWDPKRRLSAEQALEHPWFKEAPLPCRMEDMPSSPIPQANGHTHNAPQASQHKHHGDAGAGGVRLTIDRGAQQEQRWGQAFDDGGAGARARARMLVVQKAP